VLRENKPKSYLPFLMKSNLNKEGENNWVKLKGKFEVLIVVAIQIVSCDVGRLVAWQGVPQFWNESAACTSS
jgi:hypothetical protein